MRNLHLFGLIAGLTMAGIAAAPQQADERVQATHLLQRATFGVRPADIDEVVKTGRSAWLDKQLHPERIKDEATAKRTAQFKTLYADMGDMLSAYQQQQAQRRQMQQQQGAGGMANMSDQQQQQKLDSMRRAEAQKLTPEQRRERQASSPQNMLAEMVSAKLTRAVYSERQLEEMMTDFWYNHFNVFFGKGIDRFLIADYEQTAIRPHVFGKFRDLVEASAKHPAMLFYLDNASSVAVDSTQARQQRTQLERFKRMSAREQEEFLKRRNITREQLEQVMTQGGQQRQRGLNENYARELMELHTLGVDGGYTQQDVIEVARAFTGWQFTRPGPRNTQDVKFEFRMQLHDRGEKTVLGTKLPAGRGMEDGEQVLDILSRHPATAKFIATKLVERFVSDDPSKEFVDELAAVFTKTDGDLREVTRALFSSPRFYDAKVQRSKIKTPFELVASAFRVTGAEVGLTRMTMQSLRTLGHLPYNEPAPTGFPAMSEDWVNSGAMLNRMNFGISLAGNRLDGVRVDARALLGGETPTAANALPTLLQKLMPGVNTAKLEQTIRTELAKPVEETATADAQQQMGRAGRGAMQGARPRQQQAMATAPVRAPAARALGLALGSPEFQRK